MSVAVKLMVPTTAHGERVRAEPCEGIELQVGVLPAYDGGAE